MFTNHDGPKITNLDIILKKVLVNYHPDQFLPRVNILKFKNIYNVKSRSFLEGENPKKIK